MIDFLQVLSDKLTSYNLFNNFFPGLIFCYLLGKTTRFNLTSGQLLEDVFLYYLIGLTISRFGSLILETFLKSFPPKKPWLHFEPYASYTKAVKHDSDIKILCESNNTFRTISSVFLLLFLANIFDCVIYDYLLKILGNKCNDLIVLIGLMLLCTLFLLSYIKQTRYISLRIHSSASNDED